MGGGLIGQSTNDPPASARRIGSTHGQSISSLLKNKELRSAMDKFLYVDDAYDDADVIAASYRYVENTIRVIEHHARDMMVDPLKSLVELQQVIDEEMFTMIGKSLGSDKLMKDLRNEAKRAALLKELDFGLQPELYQNAFIEGTTQFDLLPLSLYTIQYTNYNNNNNDEELIRVAEEARAHAGQRASSSAALNVHQRGHNDGKKTTNKR